MVLDKLDSNKKHPREDIVGKKINDWQVIKWFYNPYGFIEDCKDKYLIRCKCGRECRMRWQSFTRKTKCCRVCKININKTKENI